MRGFHCLQARTCVPRRTVTFTYTTSTSSSELPARYCVRRFSASKMSAKPRIVVVGAGVSGLTSALELAKTGRYDVAVLAKHMPGDYDIEYASPWAGANYLPVSARGTPEEKYERDTWFALDELAKESPESGVAHRDTFVYTRKSDLGTPIGQWMSQMMVEGGPWFSEFLPNFRFLNASEAAPYEAGIAFTAVTMNVSLYLPWLISQLVRHGVTVRRGIFSHILEARAAHPSGQPADLIVNATGLSSHKLPGVADASMFPARAQIVIVRNESHCVASTTGVDGGQIDEICYIIERPVGGGTILGGCYQKGNWNGDVDYEMSARIMKRAVDICPALTDEKSMPAGKEYQANRGVDSLSVVRHCVGLRPCREGGIRVEAETLKDDSEGKTFVVHNYGHGGYGYQSSYGCAYRVAELVKESLGV